MLENDNDKGESAKCYGTKIYVMKEMWNVLKKAMYKACTRNEMNIASVKVCQQSIENENEQYEMKEIRMVAVQKC